MFTIGRRSETDLCLSGADVSRVHAEIAIDNDASRAVARDPAVREQVADELADVTGVVLALCNALGLDLSDAIQHKMAKNVLKYPVEKSRGRYRAPD